MVGMDLDQAGTELPGRTESFYDGLNGTPNMVASGLAASSQQFMDKVGKTFTPHSVLQGFPGMSGNGKSAADAERTLPGGYTLPTPNGIAEGNYDEFARMRMVNSNIREM